MLGSFVLRFVVAILWFSSVASLLWFHALSDQWFSIVDGYVIFLILSWGLNCFWLLQLAVFMKMVFSASFIVFNGLIDLTFILTLPCVPVIMKAVDTFLRSWSCEGNFLITFASTSLSMILYREHGNGHVKPWWIMPLINENIFTREYNCFDLGSRHTFDWFQSLCADFLMLTDIIRVIWTIEFAGRSNWRRHKLLIL